MLPSQVRRTILDQHVWLHEFLSGMQALAGRVEGGEQDLAAKLRERTAAMSDRFLRHLEFEEAYLVPALRDADAWGEERAERLLREHDEQRERFRALMHGLRQPCADARTLARDVRTLVRDLLADMEHEERDLLSERLLHDDPVVVDGEPE